MHISKWLLRSSIFFYTFFYKWYFFYDFIFHKSEIRTVLLEVGIVLGLLKKTLLKTSKIVLMYSNSLARHFSPMFHAKCLLPRLDKLLLIRSWLKYFYQWCFLRAIGFDSTWLLQSIFQIDICLDLQHFAPLFGHCAPLYTLWVRRHLQERMGAFHKTES